MALIIFLVAIWLAIASTNCYSVCVGGPCFNLTLTPYGTPSVFYSGNERTHSILDMFAKTVSDNGGFPKPVKNITNALVESGISNIAFYEKHQIVAAEFLKDLNNNYEVTAFYSPKALHSVPIAINLVMDTYVKNLGENRSIHCTHTPLKPRASKFVPRELDNIAVASFWVILFPLTMIFFTSASIFFINAEVSNKFLRIQKIAGVKMWIYWLINILFDITIAIIPFMSLFGALYAVNVFVYSSNVFEIFDIITIAVIFGTYLVTSLPLIYQLSRFKTASAAFIGSMNLGIFFGVFPVLIISGLEASKDFQIYENLIWLVKIILIGCSPSFGLSYASLKFSMKFVENVNWKYMDNSKKLQLCYKTPNPCCPGYQFDAQHCSDYQNYFKNDTTEIKFVLNWMFLAFVIFLFGNYLKKKTLMICRFIKRLFCCFYCKKYENNGLDFKLQLIPNPNDLLIASIKNNEQESQNIALIVNNLSKKYNFTKTAVTQIWFYIRKNHCFGLLGANGAGKTTTFKMLTKTLRMDKGDILLNSENKQFSVWDDQYVEKIGYCAQEDNLNFTLSAREIIKTLLLIKGYKNVNKLTEGYLQNFGLLNYASRPCNEYSGGTKRKLSTCMAFLGQPNVVLLDEPTSGVDPVSQQNFWTTIKNYKKKREVALVLCSHSIEECDKLCDYVAIMKNGNIINRGPLVNLKMEHKIGFIVKLYLIKEYEKEKLKDQLRAMKFNIVTTPANLWTVQSEDHLSGIFSRLEELKDQKFIQAYSINHTSLEDLFVKSLERNDQN